MNKEEARRDHELRQQLFAVLKPFIPTMVSVLETSDERSRFDRTENRRRRLEAFRKRQEKRAKR